MRWSRLQRELYKIVAPDLDFQIHCAAYPMDSRYGSTPLPRYWITLNGEIIFDYPAQFAAGQGTVRNLSGFLAHYPYQNDVSAISELLREYIDTPKDELLTRMFPQDYWGLVNILRAADRRIGSRRLLALRRKTRNLAAHKVIDARLRGRGWKRRLIP